MAITIDINLDELSTVDENELAENAVEAALNELDVFIDENLDKYILFFLINYFFNLSCDLDGDVSNDLIPVMDLMSGIAVSGKSGKRDTYQPLKLFILKHQIQLILQYPLKEGDLNVSMWLIGMQ